MTDLSEEETITLRRVLINRYVRQLAVDVRIAPESGRIRDTRSKSQIPLSSAASFDALPR